MKGKLGERGLLLGLAIVALGAWWLLRQPSPEPIQRPDAPPAPAQTPLPSPVAAATAAASPSPVPAGGPRLALVIDDWGYQSRPVEVLPTMGIPLTTAILPNLPFSRSAAEASHRLGDEVILHCPMQALGRVPEEAGTLKVGMAPAEVQALLEKHWASIPYADGLNNHQGSKATEDPALMAEVAAFAKEKGVYFLDSVTTAKSVIPAAAKAAGIPWAARRVFLDDLDQPGAIRAQLARAVAIARKQGSCIAIGHPRANTLATLRQEGPRLQAEGIELVHVSELLKR
jgi:polysaccharide deacetylase 2 family uncharacterized protein YibQ